MTSQTLMPHPSTQHSDSQTALSPDDLVLNTRIFKSVQTHYQSNHQAEFFDITAQVESLLEELQTRKEG